MRILLSIALFTEKRIDREKFLLHQLELDVESTGVDGTGAT